MAHITFDFTKGMAKLICLEETIEKKISLEECQYSQYTKTGHIEYPLDDGAKWVFRWEQYAGHEQFFRLDQFMPWTAKRPLPNGYNPWSNLAGWSYIAKPSHGTVQTNTIYRNFYYPEQFPELKHVSFEIIGAPAGDWKSDDFTEDGYYY